MQSEGTVVGLRMSMLALGRAASRRRGASAAARRQLQRVVNVASIAAGHRPGTGDPSTGDSRPQLKLLLVDANPLVWRAAADNPARTLRVFVELLQSCVAAATVTLDDFRQGVACVFVPVRVRLTPFE